MDRCGDLGKYINYEFLGFVETVMCIRFYYVTVNSRIGILIPSLSCLTILYLLYIWMWSVEGKWHKPKVKLWNRESLPLMAFWFLEKQPLPLLGSQKYPLFLEKKKESAILIWILMKTCFNKLAFPVSIYKFELLNSPVDLKVYLQVKEL